jgi:hypothetical protein
MFAVLTVASSAAAQEPTPSKPPRVLFAAIIASQVADLASTEAAIRSGNGIEANAPMSNPGVRVASKAAFAAVQSAVVSKMWKTGHKRAAVVFVISTTAAFGYVSAHNVAVARIQ